jgi:hypothetical protein
MRILIELLVRETCWLLIWYVGLQVAWRWNLMVMVDVNLNGLEYFAQELVESEKGCQWGT